MSFDEDRKDFARLVDAISPWLDQVVIIGGWAHRLYRLIPIAGSVNYPPLATLDTDVAVPGKLELKGPNIHDRLLANGFRDELLGEHTPPVTQYRLTDSKSGFYVEFLTPLTGAEYGRQGKKKATLTVGGVTSQRLRYLEILLVEPWRVTVNSSTGFSVKSARQVQVPNPTAFLIQKILIHSKRSLEDRAKDILYIHDTLEIFGKEIPRLKQLWREHLLPALHPKSIKVIQRSPATLFGQIDDSVREASRIAVGRPLSGHVIQELCAFGLSQIFL
jgi:Nucleotidyltransferase